MQKQTKQPLPRDGKIISFLDLPVEVDGKASTLSAKLEFNQAKGLGKFDITIHSKHLSLDETEREYLLKCLEVLAGTAYDTLLIRIEDYYRQQGGDHDQPSLFEEEEELEKADKKTRRPKPSKAQIIATSSQTDD